MFDIETEEEFGNILYNLAMYAPHLLDDSSSSYYNEKSRFESYFSEERLDFLNSLITLLELRYMIYLN